MSRTDGFQSSTPPKSAQEPPLDTPLPSFEDMLKVTPLPPPGPLHYAARRDLWLTPRSDLPRNTEPSTMKTKLEHALSQPGALESDEIWNGGIEKVWKGLLSGGRLRKRLPMGLVMKVMHAGWLRDPNIWPAGAIVALDKDDMLGQGRPPPIQGTSCTAVTQPDLSSGTTTPWVISADIDGARASGSVVPAGR